MTNNTSSNISDKSHKKLPLRGLGGFSPFGGWGASFGWGAFCVASLLFFALAYPHHLHYQEQFQLFLFDSAYIWDIVRLPGGVADLLGRFCTQFFLFAWVGAAIIGILLALVQLLTLRLTSWGRFYPLTFIPACLLWIFLLDENALLGGVWAVLLTLAASWLFDKIHGGWLRSLLFFAAVPVLYWIAGPVCLLFFLIQILRPGFPKYCYAAFLFLVAMIVLLMHFIPVPADKLWYGIHYYRYPMEIPVMLWVSTLSVFVLALVVRLFRRWAIAPTHYAVTLRSLAVVVAGMGCLVWKNSNFKAERTMHYDFMACHQQWNRILDTVDAERPNNQIGVTVQNLALAMRGILLQRMFDYNQNGMLGLLPEVQRDATSPLPTAEAFYQLGMVNVAQRTVFEAQEAILDYQKSARCYKRLAQTNLINGEYEVARKYLMALQKTLFYRQWANETLPLLYNEKAIAAHPEYGRMRKCSYNLDFFFGDQVTPDMLRSLYLNNKDNNIAYQYMLASFALTGDRESFQSFVSAGK